LLVVETLFEVSVRLLVEVELELAIKLSFGLIFVEQDLRSPKPK